VTRYLLRRVLFGIATLWLSVTVLFGMVRLLPGDAALMLQGQQVSSPEQRAKARHELGIDTPILQQYASWIGNALRGNLGKSLFTAEPVSRRLRRAIPVTVELAALALIISLTLSVPLGVASAVRAGSRFDDFVRTLSIGALAIPEFWLATIFIIVPARMFHWLPPLGFRSLLSDPWANARQFILPALVMALAFSGITIRIVRTSLLNVLREDYIRTARAKGLLDRQVVVRHALRNSLIPVVSLVGIQLGRLLAGAVIVEQVFALPGVGRLTLDAISSRDYTQIQGAMLFFASCFISISIAVDVAYGWLDPRIRYR